MRRSFRSAFAAFSLVAIAGSGIAAAPAFAQLTPTTAAPAPVSPHTHRVLYNGYFMGLRVTKASVDSAVTPSDFSAKAVFRTAGLAGFFQDTEITATSTGTVSAGELGVGRYTHFNAASKKNRTVTVFADENGVGSDVQPPFGSMGQPPANAEQRNRALDPVAAFLSMSLQGGAEPCDRTIPVFNGKEAFDLRLVPDKIEMVDLRGYEGIAYKCKLYYTPVAGYDPEDMADPDDYAKPLSVWLAQLPNGATIPVKIRMRVGGVGVRIAVKSIETQGDNVLLAQAAQTAG